jgi:threonine/homoserine/homoserine lactone efflux protein
MTTFLSFMAVAVGAMVVPGPDTLLVLRTALSGGAGAGTWTAAGSSTGNLVWGAASALGATGLLAASTACFTAVKLAGAAYLVVLGAQALRAGARGEPFVAPGEKLPAHGAFRRGLTCDLLNVKVGLFWTALVPQFVTASGAPLLVAAFAALAFAWLAAYAFLAARLSVTLRRRGVARAINFAAGLAFVALGAHLGS